MRALAFTLLVVLSMPLTQLVAPGVAWADCGTESSAASGAASGTVYVTVSGSPAGCQPDTGTAGAAPSLVVNDYPACELGSNVICQAVIPCNGSGRLHDSLWVYPDGHTEKGPQVCVGGDAAPPAPAQVTSAKVLTAFRSVPLPTPTLGMSPPDGITLVNLPTIFFTRAEPFGRDLKLLGRRVHLEIAPVSYAWSVGPGAEFTTDWAGAPYQDGVTPQEDPDAYVTWTYPHAAASQAATVRVTWGATWTLDGKPMGRVPGTVDMTSPAAQVTVREARGVLTGAAER